MIVTLGTKFQAFIEKEVESLSSTSEDKDFLEDFLEQHQFKVRILTRINCSAIRIITIELLLDKYRSANHFAKDSRQ